MNRTEQELRDAVFGYLEEREDMEARRFMKNCDYFDAMVDRVVRFALTEIVDWNEEMSR